MAGDIANATAAFAIALKPLKESFKKRAQEEATARIESGSQKQNASPVADESARLVKTQIETTAS